MTMLPTTPYACRAEGWRLLGDFIRRWLMTLIGHGAPAADEVPADRRPEDVCPPPTSDVLRPIRSH